jgi:MFS superfamily sulfate permease-like transporter
MNKSSLLQNATSGFLVFLIALPLCLGIAMASGFPPVAGVLTAIVGGVLTSPLGGSRLTIKGPAAGLIVIALGAVTELGAGDPVQGYRQALAVGVVAAALQVAFALLRAGRLAGMMPPSVVHGMLAAIGVIIIAKQFPVMMGVLGAHGEPLEMLAEIPHYIANANPGVVLVGLISLALLLVVPRLPGLKKVPAAVAVLAVAIPLSLALDIGTSHDLLLGGYAFHLGPEYLVRLPGRLVDALALPDFSAITSATSIKYIAMFAIVGTIESLLSVLAVDAMDPEKRASDLNRDLLVTGLGNLAAASIGGLPMISEIVRSRANIDSGATSAWSNFFHGAFLLGFVALLPGVLQLIPLAALAAMLVVTGTRLASPKEFRHAWEVGADQLALFGTTFAVTLATDLLIGVAAGLALNLVLLVARGARPLALVRSPAAADLQDGHLVVRVDGPAAFTNLLGLQRALEPAAAAGVHAVTVDFSEAVLVDHTVLVRLHGAANEWPAATLRIVGLDRLRAGSTHPRASRHRATA